MNYHTCIICGDGESYSTDCQCRNDVVAEMTQQGWSVHDKDGTDEWYCPDCLDEMPNDEEEEEEEENIPATVEYKGFTITFQKVYGEGTHPKLRCQIREDEDFFHEVDLPEGISYAIEKIVTDFTDLAKQKIDILYDVLDSTVGKFHQMLIKQQRRQMIDSRIVDKTSVFKTQVEIIRNYFTK